MKFEKVDETPKKKAVGGIIKPNMITLKKELRILVECLGFGHGKYKEFPEYGIKNSSMLKARINEIIDKL